MFNYAEFGFDYNMFKIMLGLLACSVPFLVYRIVRSKVFTYPEALTMYFTEKDARRLYVKMIVWFVLLLVCTAFLVVVPFYEQEYFLEMLVSQGGDNARLYMFMLALFSTYVLWSLGDVFKLRNAFLTLKSPPVDVDTIPVVASEQDIKPDQLAYVVDDKREIPPATTI